MWPPAGLRGSSGGAQVLQAEGSQAQTRERHGGGACTVPMLKAREGHAATLSTRSWAKLLGQGESGVQPLTGTLPPFLQKIIQPAVGQGPKPF